MFTEAKYIVDCTECKYCDEIMGLDTVLAKESEHQDERGEDHIFEFEQQ